MLKLGIVVGYMDLSIYVLNICPLQFDLLYVLVLELVDNLETNQDAGALLNLLSPSDSLDST